MNLKKTFGTVGAAVILTGGIVAPSFATDEVCTPSDAWTEEVLVSEAWVEEIKHPAVGKPVIKIDNPDYVPAWTETVEYEAVTVEHPDEYETVVVEPAVPEVPEESHTDYTYEKHVWAFKWIGTGKTKVHHNDKGAYYAEGVVRWIKVGETKHVTREYQPAKQEVTEQRLVKEAWVETISEAWTETINHPAIGDPFKWVKNPDYVKPWVETIDHEAVYETVEHPAVECPPTEEPTQEEPGPTQEPTPATPVVVTPPAAPQTVNVTVTPSEVEKTTDVKKTPVKEAGEREELAETGSALSYMAAAALGLLLVGGTAALVARRRTN